MKKIYLLNIIFLLVGCSFHGYKPVKSNVLAEENCQNISGKYSLNLEKFGNFNNLGFWDFRNYDTFYIVLSGDNIEFAGIKGGKIESTVKVTKENFKCKNGIISVNIENNFENNGGVSVYEVRTVNFYSYVKDEVLAQYVQTSTGLAFMVPVSVSEDRLVKLIRIH